MTDINDTKMPPAWKSAAPGSKGVDRREHAGRGLCRGAVATVFAQRGRDVTYVALSPAPIITMHDRSQVALAGGVEETFGNKLVIQDASARALVETDPPGEGRDLVTKDAKVVVQGRFDPGFVHATRSGTQMAAPILSIRRRLAILIPRTVEPHVGTINRMAALRAARSKSVVPLSAQQRQYGAVIASLSDAAIEENVACR